MKKAKWFVRLGSVEWKRYTYERTDDEIRLLGSVTRGASVGALGLTPEGQYVQVNGDYTSPLNASQMRKALTKASGSSAPAVAQQGLSARRGPPPLVTVKRRRVLDPAASSLVTR